MMLFLKNRADLRLRGSQSSSTGLISFLAFALIAMIPAASDALGIGVSVGGFSFSFGSGGVGGGGTGGIGDALCTIVSWFQAGSVGAAIASLAVIFLGIGAFFGKVTWGMAIMFASGIFAIFGSGEIVSAITGGASGGC